METGCKNSFIQMKFTKNNLNKKFILVLDT